MGGNANLQKSIFSALLTCAVFETLQADFHVSTQHSTETYHNNQRFTTTVQVNLVSRHLELRMGGFC